MPNLEELAEQLDATNDFSGFVKAVRSRFVLLARQSHGLQ